jgi:hypothetical protein
MTVIRCDKCGADLKPSELVDDNCARYAIKLRPMFGSLDLCEPCANALAKFLDPIRWRESKP